MCDAAVPFHKAYLILCALNHQVCHFKLQPGPFIHDHHYRTPKLICVAITRS